MSWMNLTLEQIILEYKDDYEEDNISLDRGEVNDLIRILRAKINLHEGNITQEEYDEILG